VRLSDDSVRVDQSFVHEMASKSDGTVSVRAVINIGNSLNTPVIAGNAETLERPDFLIGAGCHASQGYYLKQPMPAEEFRALLLAGTSARCD
jgi:EAL domain-containing protein (putative c-di-GMP-specific phosphodiesterase class I)